MREIFSITDKETVFGVFGRLSPEKGCLEVLEAFEQLQNKVDRVKLIYVGEGTLLEMMRERINCLNLDKKVIIAGYHEQVQPLYEAIDVLVCPSRTEGLSNVILEALAHRKPVVATRVGGNPEILTDKENGLLVDFGDISGLKNRLLELAQKPKLRLSLGQAGYNAVVERFSFHDRVKKEEEFYHDIASI